MTLRSSPTALTLAADDDRLISFVDVAGAVRLRWRRIVATGVGVAAIVYLLTAFITPSYTARATLLPPRQQQASTALSSLGVLAGAVGSVVAHTGEQYVAFLRSRSVADRIIARFQLATDDSPAAMDRARRLLEISMRFEVNRKDNLLVVEAVSDDPKRAADLANAHVEELRRLTRQLFQAAVDERRAAVQRELALAAAGLREAESALQRSGFGPADLQTDARATGDRYLALQDRLAKAEVRLAQRRAQLAPGAIELRQLVEEIDAVRAQLAVATDSRAVLPARAAGYVQRQRDYRQREQAHADLVRLAEALRLEEARGAPPVPVLDVALPPQRATSPRRLRATVLAGVAATVLALLVTILRIFWQARPEAGMPSHR